MVQKPRAQELAPEIKKEIQEELLLASFVGKYKIIPPAKSTNGLPVEVEKRDLKKFNKTFANLIEKHGAENVYSVASALDEVFPTAQKMASFAKTKSPVLMSTVFEVSTKFASETGMTIQNGELKADPDASAKLYKAKRRQPPSIQKTQKQQSPEHSRDTSKKTIAPGAMLKRLRNALQKHQTGLSGGKETEMTSQTRPSIQYTQNPMRRGPNGRGSSGAGIGG